MTPYASNPRRARLRISAATPKLHASHLIGRHHTIDQLSKLRGGYRHDVAGLVREALARRIAILHRREHGAEEQYRAIRIAVMLVHHLRNQIGGIAADLRDR